MSSTADREIVVRTVGVVKQYGEGEAGVRALNGVTCEIYRGEYLSIMGPSGSGKSTLFNMIGGLDKPTEGSVFVNSVDIAQLTARELAFLRCHTIGYIFQTFNLITVRTALENVTLPMLFAGKTPEEAEEQGIKLLDTVGLGHRVHHRPSELSGGQQQRVAIARALANDPAIVLADEPTGNLDLKTGQDIIELLRQLNEEHGVTIISATHDHKMLDVSDRIFHIRDGVLAEIEVRDGESHMATTES
ncbi:MAG TPA: ABC transporter ATP-binding protein [Fimbriimonas sp.]|nr:ABC transporter ATP-binding protein [Fimbriimonas sp.]